MDLLAATGNDGRLYLLDGTSLGGSDHKTPLFVSRNSPRLAAGPALATREADGTARSSRRQPQASGGLEAGPTVPSSPAGSSAFKLSDQGGKVALEPGWASRDVASRLAPIVVNGMVFATASGESTVRHHSRPPNARSAPHPPFSTRSTGLREKRVVERQDNHVVHAFWIVVGRRTGVLW